MTPSSIFPSLRSGLFRMALPVVLVCVAVVGAPACSNGPCSSGITTEEGESGTQYALTDTATEVRNGIELTASYDGPRGLFTGTTTNTTNATVRQIRVEIHLSNGTELGPTPRVSLAPGETDSFELDAGGRSFDCWTVHVEIGSDSG